MGVQVESYSSNYKRGDRYGGFWGQDSSDYSSIWVRGGAASTLIIYAHGTVSSGI
jgi:hypothetical protein